MKKFYLIRKHQNYPLDEGNRVFSAFFKVKKILSLLLFKDPLNGRL